MNGTIRSMNVEGQNRFGVFVGPNCLQICFTMAEAWLWSQKYKPEVKFY